MMMMMMMMIGIKQTNYVAKIKKKLGDMSENTNVLLLSPYQNVKIIALGSLKTN